MRESQLKSSYIMNPKFAKRNSAQYELSLLGLSGVLLSGTKECGLSPIFSIKLFRESRREL